MVFLSLFLPAHLCLFNMFYITYLKANNLTCITSKIVLFLFCPGQVAQLIGMLSHTHKGCRFDYHQGTYLGWGFRSGHEQEATNQCFSLTSMSFSLFLPLSLKSINISLGEDIFFNCAFLHIKLYGDLLMTSQRTLSN